MRVHLLDATGRNLGDEAIKPPDATHVKGEPALEFRPVDVLIHTKGTIEWALVSVGDKPWNIFTVTPHYVKGGDTCTIDRLHMILTPNLNLPIDDFLRPPPQLESPAPQLDDGTLRRALKRLGVGS